MSEFIVSACKSCEAPVIWAETTAGKMMPVDAEPSDQGNVELTLGPVGRPPRADVHRRPLDDGPLGRTSHFVTCPEAGSWRKR